jgi:hypothetical protein
VFDHQLEVRDLVFDVCKSIKPAMDFLALRQNIVFVVLELCKPLSLVAKWFVNQMRPVGLAETTKKLYVFQALVSKQGSCIIQFSYH